MTKKLSDIQRSFLKQLENEPEYLLVAKKTWQTLVKLLENHRLSIEECLYRIKELEEKEKVNKK